MAEKLQTIEEVKRMKYLLSMEIMIFIIIRILVRLKMARKKKQRTTIRQNLKRDLQSIWL